MKKNLLKVGLLVALSAPIAMDLASCGPKVPSESGSSSTSAIELKYNCLDEAKKNSKLTVVNFWHSFSGPNEEAVVKVVDQFNDLHVKDASNPICVTPTATGKYEDTYSRVNAAINANSGLPDLVTTYPDHVASYNAQEVMVNLDKFQKDDSIKLTDADFKDFFPGYVEESYRYVFNEQELNSYNNGSEHRGGFYSLPLNKSTEALFYNKTFFDVFTSGTIDGITVPNENGEQVALATRNGVKSAEGQKQYGADMKTREENKITVTIDGKTYKGFPWEDLKTDTGETIRLKNPSDIKEEDISTWWTYEDLITQGAIYRAISNQYVDFETGKLFKENIPENAKDKETIQKQGNFLLSQDSLNNLFVTTNVSAGKYTVVEKSGTGLKGKAVFDNPTNISNFETLRKAYQAGGFNSAEGVTGSSYSNESMEKRQTLMSIGSTAGASHVISSAQKGFFNTGVAPTLVWKNDKSEATKVIQQGTNISMMAYKQYVNEPITSDSPAIKKQKAAWEFMKYISGKEGSIIFSTSADYLPVRKSAYQSEEYKNYLAQLESKPSTKLKAETFRSAMEIAKHEGVTYTDLPFPGSVDTRNGSKSVVQNVLNGTNSASSYITAYCTSENAKYKVF